MKVEWVIRLLIYCLAVGVPFSVISVQVAAGVTGVLFLIGFALLLVTGLHWPGR